MCTHDQRPNAMSYATGSKRFGDSALEGALACVAMLALGTLSGSAYAAELAFNAYFGIPLGSDRPFVGARFGLDRAPPVQAEPAFTLTMQRGLDLRYDGVKDRSLTLNGFPIVHSSRRLSIGDSGDEASSATETIIDWRVVAAAVVGAGLIVAVATADDVSVKACSGTKCPPPEKPPPEPEPVPAAE